MAFPFVVVFLFALCATALAILCVLVGLFFFVIRRYRTIAPYVVFVYPVAFLGCAFGLEMTEQVNSRLQGFRSLREWEFIPLLVFLACSLGGTAIGGFLGYRLASRIASRFSQTARTDCSGSLPPLGSKSLGPGF
jgi:uncharacterized membrane protein YhfC